MIIQNRFFSAILHSAHFFTKIVVFFTKIDLIPPPHSSLPSFPVIPSWLAGTHSDPSLHSHLDLHHSESPTHKKKQLKSIKNTNKGLVGKKQLKPI